MRKRMINWEEGKTIAGIFQEMIKEKPNITDLYEITHIVIDNYNRELIMEIARSCAEEIIDYFKKHPVSIESDMMDTRRVIGNTVAKAHDMIAMLKEEREHSEEGGPF